MATIRVDGWNVDEENGMAVHAPANTEPKDFLWAFLSVDEHGNEGICAGPLPGSDGRMSPFVTGNERVLEFMKGFAPRLARVSGRNIRLVRFNRGEVMKEWRRED